MSEGTPRQLSEVTPRRSKRLRGARNSPVARFFFYFFLIVFVLIYIAPGSESF